MSTYKVVLSGEVLPGYEPDQVKEALAKLFKLEDPHKREQTLSRIFSGKPIAIKKGLSNEKAVAYQQAINKAGMVCDVVSEMPQLGLEPIKKGAEVRVSGGREEERQEEKATFTASPSQEKVKDEDDYNPYQQPKSDLVVPAGESDDLELVEPQKLSAGAGWNWIIEGFYYFKLNPGLWIAMVVVLFVIFVGLSVIPFGSFVTNLIYPVFIGGFMLCCRKLFIGEDFSFGDMFAGFSTNAGRLVVVGVLYSVGIFAAMAIGVGILLAFGGFGQFQGMGQMGDPDILAVLMASGVGLAALVVLALMVPLMMAYYFAPALVVLHDLPALEAMKLSFSACVRNIVPFLVFGLIAMLLCIVAAIPLMLGYLVVGPVLIGSMFAAYRQIFTASEF